MYHYVDFPRFYVAHSSSPHKYLNADLFVDFISTHKDLKLTSKLCSAIYLHARLLTKRTDDEYLSLQYIRIMLRNFLNYHNIKWLDLLMVVIPSYKRYVSTNNRNTRNDKSVMYECPRQVDNNAIIALPYHTDILQYTRETSMVIVTHNKSVDQHPEDKVIMNSYYQYDNSLADYYIKQPFKTVPRENISEYFRAAVQLIAEQLLEEYLEQSLRLETLEVIVKVIALIESISAPFYTSYLIHIFLIVEKLLEEVLPLPQHQKYFDRKVAEYLMMNMHSIAYRWGNTQLSANSNWYWRLQRLMITLFIQSNVSHKKLHAVKLMGDACRRCSYNSSRQTYSYLYEFILYSKLLYSIYKVDNHPYIIAKGQYVFEFVSKFAGLDKKLIDLLFNLLEKGNDAICRSLYSTLQASGRVNLENNQVYLLERIIALPRASCYNYETFVLIYTLMVLTKKESIYENLAMLYKLLERQYRIIKPTLRSKAINLYFEVFIMGVYEGIFKGQDHEQQAKTAEIMYEEVSNAYIGMVVLKPILQNPTSSIFSLMLNTFVMRMKEQFSRKIGLKCREILNSTIREMFLTYQVHKMPLADRKYQIALIQLLLEHYTEPLLLLTELEMLDLIHYDQKFSQYMCSYPYKMQFELVKTLAALPQLTGNDLNNLLELYSLVLPAVQKYIYILVPKLYIESTRAEYKYALVSFVLKNYSYQKIIYELYAIYPGRTLEKDVLSFLILLRSCLKRYDYIGYNLYPPFSLHWQSYPIRVTVNNSYDFFAFQSFTLEMYNYTTVHYLVREALKKIKRTLRYVRIMLNDKCLNLYTFQSHLNYITYYRYLTLSIYYAHDGYWFYTSKIFLNYFTLRPEIIAILKYVYNKYVSTPDRLNRKDAATLFYRAVSSPVSEFDDRIRVMFTNHSVNGEFLTCEYFLNFYCRSAKGIPWLIVSNLRALGYDYFFNNYEEANKYLRSNQLREQIVANVSLYRQLFAIGKYYTSSCIDEVVTLLNELPVYPYLLGLLQAGQIKDCLIENDESPNRLYYWYTTTILQHLAKYSNWVDRVDNAMPQLRQLYARYLSYLLQVDTLNSIRNDFSLHILDNIGKILREWVIKIANMLTSNLDYLTPLVNNGIVLTQNMPIVDHSYQLQRQNVVKNVDKLIQLCIQIVTETKNGQFAEHLLAHLLTFFCEYLSYGNIYEVIPQYQLIFHPTPILRKLFNTFYYLLNILQPNIKQVYYNIQVSNSRQHAATGSFRYQDCVEYFATLSKMLLEDYRDFEGDCSQRFALSYQYELQSGSAEVFCGKVEIDHILLAKITLLSDIALFHPRLKIAPGTAQVLTSLFQTCYTSELRSALYLASSRLCSLYTNLGLISNMVSKVSLQRNSQSRNDRHMGLFNLGCICYINSIMQQLHMIAPFRQGLLNICLPEHTYLSYFYQLQYLHCQLKYGQRLFLVPYRFCQRYLDNNNQPINIKEQHDADYFLNQLLDRLYNTLKTSIHNDLVSRNFQGYIANVITCQTCCVGKLRLENFYVLTVEIKNNRSLLYCLNKLVYPYIISDYFCEFCNYKVECIEKSHRFHRLPPFLFIHFQRLVFDLESFSKIRLGDAVEFPLELDLAGYFDEEQNYPVLYYLKGFIVHIGGSESGHYYSLAKEGDKWLKFDDSRIDVWLWKQGSCDKDNAYLLIYYRKLAASSMTHEYSEDIGNAEIKAAVNADVANLANELFVLQPCFIEYVTKVVKTIKIPPQFLTDGNLMQRCYHEKHSDLPEHTKLQLGQTFYIIRKCLCLQASEKYLDLGVKQTDVNKYCSNNYKYSNGNGKYFSRNDKFIDNMTCYLMLILHLRPDLASTAIESYLGPFFETIFQHKSAIIRQSNMLILSKALLILTAQPNDYLHIANKDHPVVQIMLKMLNALGDVGKNHNKMAEYWQLMFEMCFMSKDCCRWLQANMLGPKLVHFVMEKDSPLLDQLPIYPYSAANKKVECINTLLKILSLIVPFYPPLFPQIHSNTYLQPNINPLLPQAYNHFYFYRNILQLRYYHKHLIPILCYAILNNYLLNHRIIYFLLYQLNRCNHTDTHIFAYIDVQYYLYRYFMNCYEFMMDLVLYVVKDYLVCRYSFQWYNNIQNNKKCNCSNHIIGVGDIKVLLDNKEINVFYHFFNYC